MIEPNLVSAVAPIFAGKLFPDVAPSGTQPPWATYQQVGGRATAYVEQVLASERNGLFQISTWAKTRTEATTKALLLEAALIASAMQVEPVGALRATYEAETGLYGAIQDFSIWDKR